MWAFCYNITDRQPFRAIRDHMKWQRKLILSCGLKHTDPNKDDDASEFRDAALERGGSSTPPDIPLHAQRIIRPPTC